MTSVDYGYWRLPNGQRCLVTRNETTGDVHAHKPTGGIWWIGCVPSGFVNAVFTGWDTLPDDAQTLTWVTDRLAHYQLDGTHTDPLTTADWHGTFRDAS